VLQISDRVFDAMTELAGQNFRSSAANHVVARSAGTAPTDAQRIADHAIHLGESLRIVSAGDLIKFIDLLLLLGPGFETREDMAPVLAILQDEGPGWQRINRVHMLIEGIDPQQAEAAFLRPPEPHHGG